MRLINWDYAWERWRAPGTVETDLAYQRSLDEINRLGERLRDDSDAQLRHCAENLRRQARIHGRRRHSDVAVAVGRGVLA